MTINEAIQFCKDAWPGEGVTCRTVKGVCEVVAKDETVMARAFSWKPALREAYKPKLDAKQKELAETWEKKQRDFQDFLIFLREKLTPEFEEWKAKRGSGNPSGEQRRDQADQKQLVQVDAEAQRPGPASPTGLVLVGRE